MTNIVPLNDQHIDQMGRELADVIMARGQAKRNGDFSEVIRLNLEHKRIENEIYERVGKRILVRGLAGVS